MKYKVKIEDRVYEVEVLDIHTRPVVAVIEGVEFEVWPETSTIGKPVLQTTSPSSPAPTPVAASKVSPTSPSTSDESLARVVRAPIPGVIVSIFVHPGVEVSQGQELCILEAMKMKNIIRSSRAGRIAAVHVQTGQHVKHHDVLMEYLD